jgi:hypothetical protein
MSCDNASRSFRGIRHAFIRKENPMPTIRPLVALPVLLLAFVGPSHALEVIEESGTTLRMPLTPVSEAQRRADLALGNCLAHNGGRMERCGAQQAQSERIRQIDRETATRATAPVANTTPPADAPVVVIERGPVVTEGPLSAAPPPEPAK